MMVGVIVDDDLEAARSTKLYTQWQRKKDVVNVDSERV